MAFVILDGWRSTEDQRKLIEYYDRFGPVEDYVASVSDQAMRPPHTTGGAVDLTISWKGIPLALGSGFDDFSDASHTRAFEMQDSVTRRLRRLMASSLTAQGFVAYRYEWWHWSFGDDVWGASNNCPSIYDVMASVD